MKNWSKMCNSKNDKLKKRRLSSIGLSLAGFFLFNLQHIEPYSMHANIPTKHRKNRIQKKKLPSRCESIEKCIPLRAKEKFHFSAFTLIRTHIQQIAIRKYFPLLIDFIIKFLSFFGQHYLIVWRRRIIVFNYSDFSGRILSPITMTRPD